MRATLKFLAAGLMAAGVVALAGPAAATSDPNDLSPANQVLFTTNHLASITEPAKLTYDFEKKGSLEKGFTDEVEAEVTDSATPGRKDIRFRFLTGKNYMEFPPYLSVKGNPVAILFLERDVQQMQRLTGGNALYFRGRILNALAGSAEVKPVTFTYDGKSYDGREIRIEPYLHVDLIDRFPNYEHKVYTFILSKDIPGGFYRVSAMTPGPSPDAPLTDESITFHGVTKLGTKHAEKKASAADSGGQGAAALADPPHEDKSTK